MPSTWMVVGLSPCFQVRCESGFAAGPRKTVPSRWNREPWQGQSKLFSGCVSDAATKLIEHPRCEQFCAKTETLPAFLTTKAPNARSPGALSPPPSAMTKAELGEVGAR